jgi:hypothetical protein
MHTANQQQLQDESASVALQTVPRRATNVAEVLRGGVEKELGRFGYIL